MPQQMDKEVAVEFQQPAGHVRMIPRIADWLRRRLVSPDGLCLAALCLLSAALFAPHLAGHRTFIGDSDRLNTFLNIRRYTTESLADYGRVTTWNDRMFMGYGTTGLHWMVPELDPFGYLGALLPPSSVYWCAGLVSCLLMCLAGIAFYALARTATSQPIAAFAASAAYVLSSFAINRLCQVDWAYALLIFMPLAVLVVRRIRRDNLASSFAWLALLTAAMVLLTFLQEVAYVCLLLATYACYRSCKLRSWLPVGACAAAMLVGILFALPRVYTVYESFQQLDRAGSFHTTSCGEILRWLDEGIFGWSHAEVIALGNQFNPREGMLLYSSTFATLLVLAGAVRWRTRGRILCGGLFLLVLYRIADRASSERYAIATIVLVAAMGIVGFLARRREENPEQEARSDAPFHLAFVSIALAVVFVDLVRWLLYKAFFGIDFLHARIVIAALVPLNLLVAEFLGELFGEAASKSSTAWGRRFRDLSLAVGLALVASVLVVAGAPLVADMLRIEGAVIDTGFPPKLLTREVTAVTLMGIVFLMLMFVLARYGRHAALRRVVVTTLAVLIVGNAFFGAYHLVADGGVSKYPDVFAGRNYLSTAPETLQPPSREIKQSVQRRLQTEQFRTAVVADPNDFPVHVEPHLAEFYGLRLTGGYCPGVPRRLSALPWPKGVHTLRSLSFENWEAIDWRLLAVLNTKYVVVLNRDLYFNVHEVEGRPVAGVDVRQLDVYENPFPVVPRQFFARSVGPARDRQEAASPTPTQAATLPDAPQRHSIAEGFASPREFSTEGRIDAEYLGDRVIVRLTPSREPRFLVLNELYDKRWSAHSGDRELEIYPTNQFMRGVVAPPGVERIEFVYRPFLYTLPSIALMLTSLLCGGLCWYVLKRWQIRSSPALSESMEPAAKLVAPAARAA